MTKNYPSRSFHSLLDEPTKITVYETTRGKNHGRYGWINVVPGRNYMLDDDPIYGNEDFINSLKRHEIEKTYSQQIEEQLKRLGIKYRTKMCKSCGGRLKKILYHPLEFVE